MNTDCPHLESVSLLVDEELPDEDRAHMIEHLDACKACHQEFLDLQRLRSTLTSMTVDPLARQRVFSTLPQPKPAVWLSRNRISVPWPIAAAILLMLAASGLGNAYLGLRSKPKEQFIQKGLQTAGNNPEITSGGSAGSVQTTRAPGGGSASNNVAAMPAARSFVVTLETEQKTIQFVTPTDYRPYPVPRIYVRDRLNSSEER
jgi:anti-sigma factor RsiW